MVSRVGNGLRDLMDKDIKLTQDIRVSQTFLKKVLSSSDVNTLNIVSLQVNEMKVDEIRIEKTEPSSNATVPLDSQEELILDTLKSLPEPKDEALKALIVRVVLKNFATYEEAAKFLGITKRGLAMRAKRYGMLKRDLIEMDQTE